MSAEDGGFPLWRAAQLNAAVRAVAEPRRHIALQRGVRPIREDRPTPIAGHHGLAGGIFTAPSARACGERRVGDNPSARPDDRRLRRLRHDHRIEQGKAPHPPGRLGSGQQADAAADGMARQDHRPLGCDDLHQGQQIITQVIGVALVGDGVLLRGAAMAPLVDRQDAQVLAQGRQDMPIGRGVQAIGMQPDHIDGPIWIAERQHRHRQRSCAVVQRDGVGKAPGRQVVGHGVRTLRLAVSNRHSARRSALEPVAQPNRASAARRRLAHR